MSLLNTKTGLNRLFPFAKKKPNIPAKLSDKVDINTNKQKLAEDKNCSILKSSESFRCDVLTENNDKAKPIEEITCVNEIPKNKVLETCKSIHLEDDSEIKSKNKKSITRKLSNVSAVSLEEIKKPKENYQRWNIPFSSKFKGKEFDKTLLTMQDLIYYNPVTNPIIKEEKFEQKQEDDPDNDLLPIKTDQKPSIPNNCITPCIKVGADGKIIIDQETLTLNETGLEEKREELAKSKVIEESAFHLRSYSYKRKKEPSKQWTKNETLKFYKCLMNLGTDFSMVQQYFPGRTRAQIKRKYKTEEKKNPQLINGALTSKKHFDSSCIENMFQEDEPNPVEETKVLANVEKISQKRRYKNVKRSECSRISVCGYMMEEEIVLKNKRKHPNTTSTASKLKDKVLALKLIKDKIKISDCKKFNAEIHSMEKTLPIIEDKISDGGQLNAEIHVMEKTLPTIENKNNKSVPKVRKLQDFLEEYEENITKFEDDSNSE